MIYRLVDARAGLKQLTHTAERETFKLICNSIKKALMPIVNKAYCFYPLSTYLHPGCCQFALIHKCIHSQVTIPGRLVAKATVVRATINCCRNTWLHREGATLYIVKRQRLCLVLVLREETISSRAFSENRTYQKQQDITAVTSYNHTYGLEQSP